MTKVLYPLPEILLLVLSATIAGADDFVETTLWGTQHLAFLRRFYRYESGIPSHDTLCDVFAALDRRCSRPASRAGSAVYATPSPTSSPLMARPRGAATTGGRAATRCTWSPPGQRVSGSCSASRRPRRNPTRSPPFPCCKHLDLKGALVTMDAMGTQTEIAHAIRDGGGDYCMSLKKNWPAVYADVEQLFNDPPDDMVFETHETTDLTGGRIETRRHTVCHKVDWIDLGPALPGRTRVPGPGHVGRIETEVERNGKIEHETRYYLCSLALCALSFARVVRAALGGGKPPALGVGRDLPPKTCPLQDRRRAAKHGHHPPYRAQSALTGQTHRQL